MYLFDLQKYAENTAVYLEDGRELTYDRLQAESSTLAGSIKERALTFCMCTNTIASLVGYVAFVNHDIPTVLLDGTKDMDILRNLIDHYHPRYIWIQTVRTGELAAGREVCTYEDYTLLEMHTQPYEINPALLLLLTTSGSTGSPKFVRLGYDNLKSNAEAIAEYLQITPDERAITSLPMYYSYGLSVINSHLIQGASILLTDKAVIQKPFWDFAKEQHATSMAGVPYTYEMLRRLRIFQMDLPALKTFTQAGGKLNPKLVKEYTENAREQGKRFIVMYGQTEATARMSYLPAEYALSKYSSIGIAIPGGTFELADADGHSIEEAGIDGELIYKGANVSLGYAENAEDLKKGDERHGILSTGDIARRDEDGFYYITGRLKRFVKIWGNRCNLDATEQLVKTVVSDCACVGVDDLITIFVTQEGLEHEIKAYLTQKTGLNIRAFAVKVLPNIPKNGSGKVLYAELQKML